MEFTQDDIWGGRPVARRIADAQPRARVVVTGTIRHSRIVHVGDSPSQLVTIDDGSGQLQLLFLGQRQACGMEPGACATVEGTAMADTDRLVVWNPLYRIESSVPEHRHKLRRPHLHRTNA